MNRIIKSLMALAIAAMPMVMTSCATDDDIPGSGDSIDVCAEVVGTYEGTWYVKTGSDGTPVSYAGTLEISKYVLDDVYYPYACYVTVSSPDCTDIAIDGTGAANITKKSRTYGFYNEVAENGLGSVFSGEIGYDSSCTMSYSVTVKVGRNTTTYYITFEGTKK